VNYRLDPAAVARLLPEPLRPKIHEGMAIGGICLIRLEGERPTGMPRLLGMSSENAAHRLSVEWTEPDGTEREGVFVPRRDTDSLINRLVGGRLFASEYHAASFDVVDEGGHIEFRMRSLDGGGSVEVVADEADDLPATSSFRSLEESSRFFEAGSVGYSPTARTGTLDGIELCTDEWLVRPLAVSRVATSYFDDPGRFPAGTAEFDHALIMRDIRHEWRQVDSL
jgi:uncharacterized protein YqjF (DUF2071 family)